MSEFPFLSLATAHEAEQTIKKSRFIGYAAPITTETDATNILDQVQAQHAKANHAAYAYVAGDHDELTRQSDAGEPVGTAGSPILNVIQQQHLHNVIIVVTRFFGGIKLGAGGLIRAYGSSASLAIQDAPIVERKALTRYEITLDYKQAEPLNAWLTDRVDQIVGTDYGVAVTVIILVGADDIQFATELTSKTNGQAQLKKINEEFAEVPYAVSK
ncbi:YigZ family protein [Furfurilactobacillus rossiae]|uniref:Xaa-Pro dipeptidase n=1 Tax=Furfurilactobacillus rossiae DSM 15814 TaxID=1114972 RepID=A0A0R1RIZ5_9LACO|nr:YigZ family protein [Furfurilactobacillus rossiae]KRL56513.1 xaa-Pro dipeptidase [Furfurilactobacillus rossiae DSM 15814]QFR66578.1 YigZ family protein [Furfurilactobacillus rossiae]QLE62047.1 hypothetical protein LROSRS0_2002 [Furfurilactobacillus rossiae]